MKARLTKEKDYEYYKKRHKLKDFYKTMEGFEVSGQLDEILKGFKPDYSKSIQTPENSGHNVLTFSDEYIKRLKKLAIK